MLSLVLLSLHYIKKCTVIKPHLGGGSSPSKREIGYERRNKAKKRFERGYRL